MYLSDKLNLGKCIKFEKRLSVPPVLYLIVPVVSVILVLLLGGLFLAVLGYSPIEVYEILLNGAFGNTYNFTETIVHAIPLMLTGLGVSLAFKMGLWNIGAEGQLYFGAFMASGVALFFHDLPTPLMLTLVLTAGFLGGALWGFVPAALKVFLGVNETLTTLLLNYVAILWVDYFIFGPWKDPKGFLPYSKVFPQSAMLPVYPGTRIHAGLVIAILAAIILWIIIWKTTWGYEIRLIGENTQVARAAGINIAKNMLLVMIISGGLAGLAGMGEVCGIIGRLQHNISPGYGYTAIIIAWLSRLNPLVILLVAIIFGGLNNGGYALQMVGLPESTVTMLQGAILLFVLGGDILTQYRIKIHRGGCGA